MSSASPFERSHVELPTQRARRVESLLRGSVRATGFWSAVAIPFVLIGMLGTGSVDQHTALFVALVVANVFALRLGRDYNRD
jgi:hypothetical protein